MNEARKKSQDKYRKSPKYKQWLKDNYRKNYKRLRENIKRWRNKPETKIKERIRQVSYAAKLKELVFNHYGKKCICCGEENMFFLTIDHVNNDGYMEKKNGKRPGGRTTYGRIINQNYPVTYQTLCMNCNFGKAKNKGICPHYQEVKHG